MTKGITWFLLGALWLALGSSAAAEGASPGYAIKPGDRLQVSVWREEDLQLEVLVRPDGGISMPLAGDIPAQGMTIEKLREEIGERLKRYIPDPAVSVAVAEIRGNAIFVLGKVAHPGEFVIVRDIDVMQALSMAGGTTTYARLNDIKILRRNGASQSAIPFRYGDVEKGRDLEQNIILQSGDTVVVP
jgi:polysaccharide export outer membrane protein